MELSEQIRRIRAGDQSALSDIIRTYGGDVYQRALQATGSREIARQVTRQMISELVSTLTNDPSADGYTLWIRTLSEKSLLMRDAADSEALHIGAELAAPEGEAPRDEVPVYTSPRELPLDRDQSRTHAVPDRGGTAPAARPSAEPYRPHIQQAEPPPRKRALVSAPVPVQNQRTSGPQEQKQRRKKASAANIELIPKETHVNGFAVVLLCLLCLTLGWFVLGLMMRLSWFPAIDLGYLWFDQNVYPLF